MPLQVVGMLLAPGQEGPQRVIPQRRDICATGPAIVLRQRRLQSTEPNLLGPDRTDVLVLPEGEADALQPAAVQRWVTYPRVPALHWPPTSRSSTEVAPASGLLPLVRSHALACFYSVGSRLRS